MGGKTQQRVAGNVKPSSSGRIRDLLINKHGAGNIITFGVLSNNSQQLPTVSQQDSNETDRISKAQQAGTTSKTSSSNIQPNLSPSTAPNDKPTLVMRRIGNRDYFTRVKVAQPEDKVPELEKGVYKPKPVDDSDAVLRDGSLDDRHDLAFEQGPSKGIFEQQQNKLPPSDQETIDKEDEDEKYDFDTTLEQLTQIRDTIGSNVANSFEDLDDKMIGTENELLRLLDILVKHFSDELSIEEWDLVVRSVYKWTCYISNSDQSMLEDITRVNFSVSVLNFIRQLIILAKSWRAKKNSKEEVPMMQSLLDDWDNFHSSDVYHDLIFLYFKLASVGNLEQGKILLIESLSNIVLDVDPELVLYNSNLSEFSSTTRAELEPHEIIYLTNNTRHCNIDENKFKGFMAICSLLKSDYRAVIVSAHSMLTRNMGAICLNAQASLVITEQDDIDNIAFVPPAALMSILASRDSIMSALLSDYQVGDISVTIDPKSDSYTCTLTYLLVWDLVIQFIVGFYKEMGHRMIHSLKRLGLIQRLLDNVFMLLPPLGERDSLNFRVETGDNDRNIHDQPWCLSSFLKSPLKTTIHRPVNEIELMALHIYFSVALHMPVTVRKWYNNNSNKRLCNLVNEYTVKHISKVICSLEMETVQEKCQERAHDDKMNNLVIKARPNAGEVYVVYIRDEFRMELTIKLPINYPLGSVQIDGGKRVGVTDLKWRSWLLQLTTFLSHQNGPILDGIDLWRKNIDKKFEGVEKCMICFSILHSNYQLPKKKCQTCTKMFHNLCLYKWFKSSGNSTCPLCRNTW